MENSSMSSVWGEEWDKKSLSSNTSKKQIDINEYVDCVAGWDDWGLFIDDDTGQCLVRHLRCHTKIRLPCFRHFNDWTQKLQKCVVSPSTHEYFLRDGEYLCNVSLFFNEDEEPPYCLICAPPNYNEWVKVTLTLGGDDNSKLRDAVTFCNGEKICTLFVNGRLGIIQMTPEITTLSPLTFRVPTDATACYRVKQLVSWQHQLFFIQRKSGSPSIFEVWEADFETKQFNRVFNLDGFIILLCQGYAAAISLSLTQEKNHVYFTQYSDLSTLYAFNIADQSFSTTKQFRVYSPDNSILLFERSGSAKIQHNTSARGDKFKKQPSSSSSKYGLNSKPVDNNICIHLSLDLQREISRYLLSQEAYMSFRSVCKLWRSLAPPLRWKVVDRAAPSYDQDSMWLLSLNQKDGLCTFYNPFRNFNCYMSNNDLVGCEIRYAKDGWLLVSRGKSLFLLKPSPSSSGKQIIHLPQRTEDYFCDTMSFSASPTNSSAWVIFGVALLDMFHLKISYLRKGDAKWTSMIVDNEVPFLLSSSSPPVYFGEEFCLISTSGDVGAFGFLIDGSPYWVIHQFFHLYSPPISGTTCRSFLIQRDQILHSVVVARQHNIHNVIVYELELGSHKVKLVKGVKNWLFFASEASFVAVCHMKVNVDDAVFFPTFNTSNDYTYYSLEDATFKKLKDYSTDKTQQKELLNRVWIRCERAWN